MADLVLLLTAGPAADLHDTGRGHPERRERIQAVESGIAEAGLAEAVSRRDGRHATPEELLRVHHPEMLARTEQFVARGGGDIDADTHVSSGSWEAALMAAGSGLAAIEMLDRGEGRSAFVSVRPPGHHATVDTAMGFCLINNVAVAAAALAARGERVAIVDWDVHHGNGTQEIFWDDPRVLYISTHQWPCYPGTGRPGEVGGPNAVGTTVNVPLPPGATGDSARAALADVAEPVLAAFDPTWILVSAGFDAHRDDPLASLEWSAGDFTDLATTVAGWAPGPGRLVAFLEGGYDEGALARSAAATIAALAGVAYRPEAPTSGGPGLEMVEAVAALRRRAVGD